jgi:transposase
VTDHPGTIRPSAGLYAIAIWFVDEACVGRRTALPVAGRDAGPSPCAPQDQRYTSTPIFGAVCPREGKGAALVLPICNTAAMKLHLAEISERVSPGKHATQLLDQAGYHLSGDGAVPNRSTLLALPPRCPGLNVMENVWQVMRNNQLSNSVFSDHDDIVEHGCHHWNHLIDHPWHKMSIGRREWAHRF